MEVFINDLTKDQLQRHFGVDELPKRFSPELRNYKSVQISGDRLYIGKPSIYYEFTTVSGVMNNIDCGVSLDLRGTTGVTFNNCRFWHQIRANAHIYYDCEFMSVLGSEGAVFTRCEFMPKKKIKALAKTHPQAPDFSRTKFSDNANTLVFCKAYDCEMHMGAVLGGVEFMGGLLSGVAIHASSSEESKSRISNTKIEFCETYIHDSKFSAEFDNCDFDKGFVELNISWNTKLEDFSLKVRKFKDCTFNKTVVRSIYNPALATKLNGSVNNDDFTFLIRKIFEIEGMDEAYDEVLDKRTGGKYRRQRNKKVLKKRLSFILDNAFVIRDQGISEEAVKTIQDLSKLINYDLTPMFEKELNRKV